MDQSNRLVSGNLPLGQLVGNALGELEKLRYSRRSLDRYRAIWTRLIEFSRQKKLGDEFSGNLAARFVEEYRAGDKQAHKPGEGWWRHIAFGVQVLADFAQYGRIGRARADIEKIHLRPATKKVLRDYEQYCKDGLQLRPATLQKRTGELTIFLDFLSSRKAKALDEIQALDLSEFLSFRGHLKPNTVSRVVSDVRSFLRFLTMRGILQKDLSVELPKVRVPRDASIPSVWDHDLISKLLGAIDRSSAKGKRDYAILLLACRLGLRAGDIRTLKLDHLRWEDSRIEITQSKTATPLSLPLTEEVGEALIDYLKSGRPKTAHREVFLKLTPPFDPFGGSNNLYDIVRYWRQLAGITFRTPQKRGIHSLRHTLATRLLEQGTPFSTIADILGHTSLESTRIYAKADVEALRSVALDTEEVNHAE
ncbi:MAG: tyrosine-type recombinase/integrase [Burkholderiales bacterium]|nr:tyrosine-type recombinase/integrase [Burkholderiales bacterium]